MKGKKNKNEKSTKVKKVQKAAPKKEVVKEEVKVKKVDMNEVAVTKEVEVAQIKETPKVVVDKKSNFNLVCLITMIIGLFVVIGGAFLEDYAVLLNFVGVALVAIALIAKSIKSESYGVVKSLFVMFLAVIALSWLIPPGGYTSNVFAEGEIFGISFAIMMPVLYNAFAGAIESVVFLLSVAIFYAVIGYTKTYNDITSNIANKLDGKKLLTSIVVIVLLVGLTSLFTQTIAVIAFIPFIISILRKLNFDKVTAFAITFGSLIVGSIAAPWGTMTLINLSSVLNISFDTGIEYRYIITLAATALFILFVSLKLKDNKTISNEIVEDAFIKNDIETKKVNKVSSVVISLLFIFSLVMLILGFIDWETNFGILTFNELHTSMLEFELGDGFFPWINILGQGSYPMGKWILFDGAFVLVVIAALVALINRMSMDEVINSVKSGLNKFAYPIAAIVLLYLVSTFLFLLYGESGQNFVVTINDAILSMNSGFEPNLASLSIVVSSIFHFDVAYVAGTIGTFFLSAFTTSIAIVSVLMTSMFGLVQLFAPTSLLLVIGLTYSKVSYKAWLQYIWMYLVGIAFILILLFNVVIYL